MDPLSLIDQSVIEEAIDKIISTGRPRSIFVLTHDIMNKKLVSCPEGGIQERRYIKNDKAVLVGTYDCEVTSKMLKEDLECLGFLATSKPTRATLWSALMPA
jgi:hypothetical protein